MKKIDIVKILIKVAKEYADRMGHTGLDEGVNDLNEDQFNQLLDNDLELKDYNGCQITYNIPEIFGFVRVLILDPRPKIIIKNNLSRLYVSLSYGLNSEYDIFSSSQVTTKEGLELSVKLRRRITTLINKHKKDNL
jgi:hypothetical protein